MCNMSRSKEGQFSSKSLSKLDVGCIKGGETNFLSTDGQCRAINPCTGQALVFDHKIRHEGALLEIGIKFAIRTGR